MKVWPFLVVGLRAMGGHRSLSYDDPSKSGGSLTGDDLDVGDRHGTAPAAGNFNLDDIVDEAVAMSRPPRTFDDGADLAEIRLVGETDTSSGDECSLTRLAIVVQGSRAVGDDQFRTHQLAGHPSGREEHGISTV